MTVIEDILSSNSDLIEHYINDRIALDDACDVCPENGAVVLDFADCSHIHVRVTENITAFRCINRGSPGTIYFIIPRNTTRILTGFPDGWFTEGDEGSITLSGGTAGATYTIDHPGDCSPPDGPPGGGPGCPGCGNGEVSITCHEFNGLIPVACEIDCNDEEPSLDFVVQGLRAPYTWTTTGGSIESIQTRLDTRARLTAPTGTTSVSGNAFVSLLCRLNGCFANKCGCAERQLGFGCDNLFSEDLGQGNLCNTEEPSVRTDVSSGCPNGVNTSCPGGPAEGSDCADQSGLPIVEDGDVDSSMKSFSIGTLVDIRTQQMIDDGCDPCVLALDIPLIVTVTDSLGDSLSKTITLKDNS